MTGADLSASGLGASLPPYKSQDDYMVTLQNLLATEGSEKEASQAEMHRWKKWSMVIETVNGLGILFGY